MSIVKIERLQAAYEDKIRFYEEPTRLTKESKNINYSKTILIIITV